MEETYTQLADRLEAFTAADFEGHERERLKLIASARKLVSRLETDVERFYGISFAEPIIYAALKTCIDTGLLRGWTAAGGGEKSLEDIAKLASNDCDLNLLRRLLRLLASTNIIEETGEDRYKPTSFSLSIGDDSTLIAQALIARAHHWETCSQHFPSFLAKTSYREPLDSKKTSYHESFPEGLPFFERGLSNPIYQESWSGFMTAWAKYKIPWPQFYDTASLIEGADLSDGKPLVVDIGGHHGVDLLTLPGKHPDLSAGSLILQDLPGVVSGLDLGTDKVKVMGHDFFEPQPIHGSRAYFFHAVFHDWSDEVAIKILRNIVPAMKKGYSKLLICDIVIPPTGASIIQSVMDVNMMSLLSAYERTEAMWRKLINEAGFNITGIWKDPRDFEAVIEAELA
ncbi:putative O-methyltransferase [Hypoxylon rubiginosum]|uniref:O-methyltransferase n=1 Tax=Hypoxylon rubiginosum TaxID=110542 RepID=A0ACC0DG31_9PEZI|nr:putative O-methyltransferase [Hypoxylon rubiginosum]